MLDKLASFAEQPTVSPLAIQNGNTPWAQRYAGELREVVTRYADRLPRNVQRHLGPSELGHHCDRQLAGKMAGVSFGAGAGNLLHDPWPSIVGTAIHAFLDKAFTWDAEYGLSPGRWVSEQRVCPDPGAAQPHPGTADLYDRLWQAVVDHKCQSEPIRTRLRRDGPPFHYFVQLLLYAAGYMLLGFEVQRVCLASWPRTKSSMGDMFVWEHLITAADLQLVIDVLDKTRVREEIARLITQGRVSFWEVPATPSEDDCQYCPFFNPAALRDATPQGCPGTSMLKGRR